GVLGQVDELRPKVIEHVHHGDGGQKAAWSAQYLAVDDVVALGPRRVLAEVSEKQAVRLQVVGNFAFALGNDFGDGRGKTDLESSAAELGKVQQKLEPPQRAALVRRAQKDRVLERALLPLGVVAHHQAARAVANEQGLCRLG